MKATNRNRADRRRKPSTQVQNSPGADRNSADHRAGEEQPPSAKPDLTPEDLAIHQEMRRRKLRSPVSICLAMASDGEQPDARLAEFLAYVIWTFGEDLWDHVISKIEAPREVACFGEIIAIAEEVAQHAIQRDNRKAKGLESGKAFLTNFFLPGLANEQNFGSPAEVLKYLAMAIYPHIDKIRQHIIDPSSDHIGNIEMSEALVIAQGVVDRASGDDEIESCERLGTYTRITQLSWQIKAAHYSEKLRKQSAVRKADIESDRQMDARRAAA